jgi:hypothetical protein
VFFLLDAGLDVSLARFKHIGSEAFRKAHNQTAHIGDVCILKNLTVAANLSYPNREVSSQGNFSFSDGMRLEG